MPSIRRQPLLAPAVSVHGGHGRQHVAGGHVDHPVDEVDRLEDAAHVVDVVRVAVVRGVDRDDRVQRGRSLHRDLDRVEARPTTCRTSRPSPCTTPASASHAITSQMSACSCALYSSSAIPSEEPVPAEVEPADGEAALLAEPLVLARVRRREVVHAVRKRVDDGRRRAARRGGRAARRAATPSSIAIQTCRCSTGADPMAHLRSPRVDLRLTDAQLALREEAAAFAAASPSEPGGGSRVAAPGDALRRRLARGHPRARGGRLDRDDVAGGARRARAHARRRGARRGRLRLPLAPALALPPLLQDDRLRARALRLARAQGATPRRRSRAAS